MPRTRTWEEECLPRLVVQNSDGAAALCILWNLIERVQEIAPELAKTCQLSVIGNLRTPIGISWFVRGLWLMPNVSRVVLWGKDLQQTGEALVRLWHEGPTADHQVPGFGWRLDPLVPREAIDKLRGIVELIDLRHLPKPSEVLPWLDRGGRSRSKSRSFAPVELPDLQTLPSLPGHIMIRATDPGDAWQRILHHLLQYGMPRDTRKKESIVHHFSVKAIFPVLEEDDSEAWFGISKMDAENYLADVLRPAPPTMQDASGHEVPIADYHYGQRIQDWLGHNQLGEVILRIRDNSETKRGSISILQTGDLEDLEDAPCWSLITFAVINGALHSSNIFRSHDMFGGWPNNCLAILQIHRKVARELGLLLGSTEIVSQNAQVYTRHMQTAKDWLLKRGFMLERAGHFVGFRPDPAGAFVFSIVNQSDVSRQYVRAQLFNQAGDQLLWETEHANPRTLIRWIVESMVLDPQHVRYLGGEEERIVQAIRTGESYHQDQS